jgi:diaminopimelate decarboxylase
VLPSLKANTSPALRRILNQEGLGCDVFADNELHLALGCGVPAAAISLNGPAKSDAVLEYAVRSGVKITADSLDEVRRLIPIAHAANTRALVRFRMRASLTGYAGPSDLARDGRQPAQMLRDYRPGIPRGELAECVDAAIEAPELEPIGLAAHATRQTVDLAFWRVYALEVGRTAAELARRQPGWLREVDLGGGFAAPRDPTSHAKVTAGRLAPTPEQYVDALIDGLTASLHEGGLTPEGIELQIEPGRAIYANAGIHLARVLHVKHEPVPPERTWIETDTSEAFLPDTLIEANRWTALLADDLIRRDRIQAAVTGASCGFDVLIEQQSLPAARPGELLAFLDTGAYQDAASSNFNAMCRPATVLVDGASAQLIRRRESLEDVLARDVVPAPAGELPTRSEGNS